jgi:hypothetical protein
MKTYKLICERFGRSEVYEFTSKKPWQSMIYGLLYSSQENGYNMSLTAIDKAGKTTRY